MSVRAIYLLSTVLLCLPFAGQAENNRWGRLLKKNPFHNELPPPAPVEKAPQLELRGVLVEGKVIWFNVYNADTKESSWLQRGDRVADLAVKDYDAGRETLMLDYRQKLVSVALKESGLQLVAGSGRSAGAVASSSAMPVAISRSSVSVAAMPAGENRRLEQVATEIRQRREQRKKQTNRSPGSES